jgi:hypothetical protein
MIQDDRRDPSAGGFHGFSLLEKRFGFWGGSDHRSEEENAIYYDKNRWGDQPIAKLGQNRRIAVLYLPKQTATQ